MQHAERTGDAGRDKRNDLAHGVGKIELPNQRAGNQRAKHSVLVKRRDTKLSRQLVQRIGTKAMPEQLAIGAGDFWQLKLMHIARTQIPALHREAQGIG